MRLEYLAALVGLRLCLGKNRGTRTVVSHKNCSSANSTRASLSLLNLCAEHNGMLNRLVLLTFFSMLFISTVPC